MLGSRLDRVSQYVRETRSIPLGVYHGLRFGLVLHPQFAPDLYLEGASTRRSMLSREHHGPRAILNAAERLANSYDAECERVRQDLAIAGAKLRDYQARIRVPFPHEAYLDLLTALRDQLKAGLSDAAQASTLGVSHVAEQIKSLKAAHTIDAAPARIGKRNVAAEEPVTARIRRRMESILTDPLREADGNQQSSITAG